MGYIHQTRHQLCNKRTSKSIVEANNSRSTKAETPSQAYQGNKALQAGQSTIMNLPAKAIPDLNVFVESDWEGCPTTRRSTTGFLITLLETTINYGSRTQATIALSSAEAELHAISTGAKEALLHIRNLLMELLNVNKINIKIHTDSSSGKSMATRISRDYVRLIEIHKRQPSRHLDQARLNRDSATTPSTSWTWHPAPQPSLKPQANSFTSSLQQASSNTSIHCSARAPIQKKFHYPQPWDQQYLINLLLYINMI